MLRTYGTQGLRVADLSVLPEVAVVNTQAIALVAGYLAGMAAIGTESPSKYPGWASNTYRYVGTVFDGFTDVNVTYVFDAKGTELSVYTGPSHNLLGKSPCPHFTKYTIKCDEVSINYDTITRTHCFTITKRHTVN